MSHRAADYAVHRGHTYAISVDPRLSQASLIREDGAPAPEGLRPDPRDPDRVFFADPGQLDAWYHVKWTFRWRGQLFEAIGSNEEEITGWFAGDDLGLVRGSLRQIEASAYMGTFPRDEITDLTENRTDLLARWKEKHQS